MKVYILYFDDGYDYGEPEKAFSSREAAEEFRYKLKSSKEFEIAELEVE